MALFAVILVSLLLFLISIGSGRRKGVRGKLLARTHRLLHAMDLQLSHLCHLPADYLPRAVRALGAARAAGVPVIHVALRLSPGRVDAHPRNNLRLSSVPPAHRRGPRRRHRHKRHRLLTAPGGGRPRQITVLSDACADRDPAPHHTLLNDVLSRRGEVSTIEEWTRALNATSPPLTA
jgi:nicotinamidase-related amidase